MTIIEKIKTEIERRFFEYNQDSNHHIQAAECASILDFLDTLQEQPEPFFYCKYGGQCSLCADCKRNHSNSPYKTEDIKNWFCPFHTSKQCDSYIKQEQLVSEELEERWDELQTNFREINEAFEAGKKEQSEQMMNEAVEGRVILRDMYDNRSLDIDFVLPNNLKIGDRVRVIVLPKEDEK